MNAFLSSMIISSLFSRPVQVQEVNTVAMNVKQLRDQLLNNYDPWTRPSIPNPLQVYVETSAMVRSVGMSENLITVDLWFLMTWKDDSLMWNPDSNNNLTEISIDSSKLWKPDVTLYNSHQGPLSIEWPRNIFNNNLLTVSYDGQVHFVHPQTVTATCTFDPTFFPFDHHQCQLILGSWSHHLGHLNLIPQTGNLLKIMRSHTTGFTVDQYSLRDELHFDNDTFAAIKIYLNLERSSTIYDYHLKYQLAVIIICVLIVYLISPKYFIIRSILPFFTIISSAHLILITSNMIGFNSKCNLLDFLSVIILLSGLSIINSLITFLISSKLYNKPLPMRISSTVNGIIGKVLFLESTAISYDLITELEKRNSNSGQLIIMLQEEWILFATMIDRVILIIYAIIILITFPSFS